MFGRGKVKPSKIQISGPTAILGPTHSLTRPFSQRLNDFGPALTSFLGKVWRGRATVSLSDFSKGRNTIYGFYAGTTPDRPYNELKLVGFVREMKSIAGKYGYKVYPQDTDATALDSPIAILVNGEDLWTEFFHVIGRRTEGRVTTSRVYINAVDSDASLDIMAEAVKYMSTAPDMWEVKNTGPGPTRLDTIVAYFYTQEAADTFAQEMVTLRQREPTWFGQTLPPLVTVVAPGIGQAGQPPSIEIYKIGGTNHSFGSFYSTLCWMALRRTPNVRKETADGRHFLDNVLHSLRLMNLDPKNPTRFPDNQTLERWYQATLNVTVN